MLQLEWNKRNPRVATSDSLERQPLAYRRLCKS